MDQCCKTCIFSRWELTPTGRIAAYKAGYCTYKVVLPPLPESVTMSHNFTGKFSKSGITAMNGVDCPVYQPNPGGLQKRTVKDNE